MGTPADTAADAEFAALAAVTPLPPFSFPDLSKLPYIGYDIVHRLCGIDLHDDEVPLARKLAANEWFWRRAAGQPVTFEQVWMAGSLAGMRTPDLGNGAGPAAATTPAGPNGTGSP
jgi:hypothetical protein